MAVIRCDECQNFIDDDVDGPCEEHPQSGELICPDCFCELEEAMEEEVNGEDFVKPRVPFDRNQRLTAEVKS